MTLKIRESAAIHFLVCCLLISGCASGGSEDIPTATFSPAARSVEAMLTAEDIPGTTTITWYDELQTLTACENTDAHLYALSADAVDGPNVTAEYHAEGITVHETLVVDPVTSDLDRLMNYRLFTMQGVGGV